MSDSPAVTDTTNVDPSASVADSGSFESYLQNRRAQLQAQKQHVLAVPGFEGKVFGVYHNLSYKQLRAIAHRHEKLDETTQELYGSADILVTACDRLYGKGEDGTTAELGVWSVELAKKFGIENVETARQAVLAVFQGHELNLIVHSGELINAMQESDQEVDDELGN